MIAPHLTTREAHPFSAPVAISYVLALAFVGWLASLTVRRAGPDAGNAGPARESDGPYGPPARSED